MTEYNGKTITMNLDNEPFRQIYSGEKTVEVRLNDERRKSIRVGDTIQFFRNDNDEEYIVAQVVALHNFPSFQALFSTVKMRRSSGFGNLTANEAAEKMYRYYTKEQEQQYGVLGIEIVKE